MPWAVVRSGDTSSVKPRGGEGLTVRALVGAEQGAVHIEVALVELAPGGLIDGQYHPFEESCYLLEGEVLLAIGGETHHLRSDDYGYAPVAMPHAWRNPGETTARWLRIRSPQPRTIGGAAGTHTSGVVTAEIGRPVDSSDPTTPLVGHFDPDMLPAPGPLQMKGFRSADSRNVGLWLLIDEVVGAVHHTVFVVQCRPMGSLIGPESQHFHPFEETYYVVSGEMVAHLEDEAVEVQTGDLIFAGVNTFHGFSNISDAPVRWIEAQAPVPPGSGAFYFRGEWTGH